jgi:hypothetical protein
MPMIFLAITASVHDILGIPNVGRLPHVISVSEEEVTCPVIFAPVNSRLAFSKH